MSFNGLIVEVLSLGLYLSRKMPEKFIPGVHASTRFLTATSRVRALETMSAVSNPFEVLSSN